MTTGLPSKTRSKIDLLSYIFTTLVLCFVVTSPLNNSYEVAAMMTGTLAATASASGVPAWTVSLTPIYIKALKDAFVVLTALLMLAGCIKSPKKARIFLTRPFMLLNIFTVIVLLTALYSLSFMPLEIVVMGIRGYWSVIFVYAGALYCTLDEKKVFHFVLAIFSLHFMLQAVQFVTDVGSSVYFQHRSPGAFMIPSTAGAFAILVYFFAIKFKSFVLKMLAIVSLLLSNSTTGLLILVVYYIYSYRNRFKPKILYYPVYLIATVVGGYAFISNIGEVTGRGEGASFSALTRFGLFYTAMSNWKNLLFGLGMGVATSQALISGYSHAVIADNTYLGVIYNAGVVPSILILAFVAGSYRYFENKLLYFLLLGYSMTTVIFEINPVVQLTLIFLGVHIGRKYTVSSSSIRAGIPHPVRAARAYPKQEAV
jgi:hypothetical protein